MKTFQKLNKVCSIETTYFINQRWLDWEVWVVVPVWKTCKGKPLLLCVWLILLVGWFWRCRLAYCSWFGSQVPCIMWDGFRFAESIWTHTTSESEQGHTGAPAWEPTQTCIMRNTVSYRPFSKLTVVSLLNSSVCVRYNTVYKRFTACTVLEKKGAPFRVANWWRILRSLAC